MVVLSTPSVSPGDSSVRKTFRQAGECYSRSPQHLHSRARDPSMRKSMTGISLAVLLLGNTALVGAQDVYVYPAKNQSNEQMARDKEECHGWAVKQTGVDPEKLATESVTPPPSGGSSSGAGSGLGGAGFGAARGAMSGDAAAGAIRGVGIGRLAHAIRARRQMEEQHQASQQQDQASLQQHQQRQSLLQNYDRAFGACLTGRGYSVQ